VQLCSTLRQFWRRHPALFVALHLYVGTSLSFGQSPWTLAVLIPLWVGLRPISLALSLLVPLAMMGYVSVCYRFPKCPPEGIEGIATVIVDEVILSRGSFGNSWLLRGEVRRFLSGEEEAGRRLPLYCHLPFSCTPPEAGFTYEVPARLTHALASRYRLKVSTKATWKRVGPKRWLTSWRAIAKDRVRSRLESEAGKGQTTSFLCGVAMGDLADGQLLLNLSRFGLQHLIAISGFHFSILAGICAFMLRWFLNPCKSAFASGLLLTLYFLFVGPAASVKRAWLMGLLFLLGVVTARPSRGANALGMALLVVLLSNPPLITTLGFQFSFACTAALILLTRPAEQVVAFFWRCTLPPQAGLGQKLGFLATTLCRRALAVSLAVNAVAAPLTLVYYHRFPLTGVLMNLFFPLAITLLMVLLLAGLLTSLLIPAAGSVLVGAAWRLADLLLRIPGEIPAYFDFYLRAPGLAPAYLACGGALLLTIGAAAQVHLQIGGGTQDGRLKLKSSVTTSYFSSHSMLLQ
jgi:competence protein ComEC